MNLRKDLDDLAVALRDYARGYCSDEAIIGRLTEHSALVWAAEPASWASMRGVSFALFECEEILAAFDDGERLRRHCREVREDVEWATERMVAA